MENSIAGIMNFNMFGIPHTGADICGFFENPDKNVTDTEQEEICARWYQLSTFYPFARNHHDMDNGRGGANTEPYNLGDSKTMAINSIKLRYKYILFMYSCMFTTKDGNTCFDPMLFHYPDNEEAYENIERSFIVGDALKVSPVTWSQPANHFTYSSWFPQGEWVNMNDLSDILTVNDTNGTMMNLTYPTDTINHHMRPGYIIPVQTGAADDSVMSTTDLRSKDYSLYINRDMEGNAQGRLFLDSSDSLSQISENKYEDYNILLSKKQLTFQANMDDTTNVTHQGFALKEIKFVNAKELTNTDFACYFSQESNSIVNMTIALADSDKSMVLSADGLKIKDIMWMNFGKSGMDLNLCATNPAQYTWVGTDQDLSGNTFNGMLRSGLSPSNDSGADSVEFLYPDLNVTLSVLKSGAVNVHWTYAMVNESLPSGYSMPFEVPSDIIATNRSDLKSGEKLSDYLTTSDGSKAPLISIKSGKGQTAEIFDLGSLVLKEHFNYISTQVHTKQDNFKGIMGLAERTVSDLFLPDGIYTLWSRDAANPVEDGRLPGKNLYGVHPFYMAKATDDRWFGVYTNLAAA
jgi:alpha-glucosidase (family GH31 glycosyl hydrolase)